MMLEEGSVWRGLQEVHDGADPADVYARLTSESEDIEEAIENMIHDETEAAHDFGECREKVLTASICHGFTCQSFGGVRLMTDCPCACHQHEYDDDQEPTPHPAEADTEGLQLVAEIIERKQDADGEWGAGCPDPHCHWTTRENGYKTRKAAMSAYNRHRTTSHQEPTK